jgi:small basic protein
VFFISLRINSRHLPNRLVFVMVIGLGTLFGCSFKLPEAAALGVRLFDGLAKSERDVAPSHTDTHPYLF